MDSIRADRIRLLYASSFPAVFMSLAAGAILAALLWPAADHAEIVAWLALLAAASAARIVLFTTYRARAPKEGPGLLAWEKPYAWTLLASSATWGFGAAWIMPKGSLLHQALTIFVLVGMAGAALAAYSAIRKLVVATLVVVLLPATAWLFASPDLHANLVGVGVLLFLLSSFRASRVISDALQQNFQLTHALREAAASAERIASIDALTGLANRRSFEERGEAPFQFCRRNALPIAAVVIDLDHFKQINDTRGHAVGDEAIRHCAKLIQSGLRRSDLCCRWGGEEFVILLPGTTLAQAAIVAEDLRATFEQTPVPAGDAPLAVTASLGVAEGRETLEALIHRADLALYRAKREGRNRVACDAAPEPAEAVPA
jgi:diguanylate cyclase (GGDEF)-like protein